MENEISIGKIFSLMVGRIWMIIILVVICGAAAFSYAEFMLPLQYQSYTSLYVKNSTQEKPSDSVALGDINASKSLVNTYIAVLQDDAVLDAIGEELLKQFTPDQLDNYFSVVEEDGVTKIAPSSIRKCITMASVDQTEVMKVTAVTGDANISAALCNTVASVAPEFLVRVVGAGSVEAIGPARIHESPVSPSVPKYTLIGALLGGIIACGITLLLYFIDNTVKDPDTIARMFETRVIGEISNFEQNDGKRRSKKTEQDRATHLLSEQSTPFYIVESYKTLRSNLLFALAPCDKKVIAFSSANPSEGKSITTANLAITMAQLGRKILLIDADLRKPVVHKLFLLKNVKGLSNVLAKLCKPADCISHDVIPQLDVMTSGTMPPNPSELLGSEQMGSLLETLADTYDYILIDTPPVNVVSDALCLSPLIAGLVIVLRYGSTTFDDTKQALEKLHLSNANVLGFAFNGITLKQKGGFYRQKYRYASKYSYEYSYGGLQSANHAESSDAAESKDEKKQSKK